MPTPDAGGPAACTPPTNLTLAVKIVMDANWPQKNPTTKGGTGKILLWNLSRLKVTGSELSGDQTQSCGTVLPEFELLPIGAAATTGNKIHIQIPHEVWDAPTIPKFKSMGRLMGWNPGSSFAIDGTIALVGLTMDDPLGAWPASSAMIKAVDADGDGKPGFTAAPRLGGGYAPPPAAIGLGALGPKADKLYLASRTVVSLEGKLTSCTEVAGTANVRFFDSHVVGCHVMGMADCNTTQTEFVDTSKTDYKVTGATFTAKTIPDNATCADVRMALP